MYMPIGIVWGICYILLEIERTRSGSLPTKRAKFRESGNIWRIGRTGNDQRKTENGERCEKPGIE